MWTKLKPVEQEDPLKVGIVHIRYSFMYVVRRSIAVSNVVFTTNHCYSAARLTYDTDTARNDVQLCSEYNEVQ